MVWLSMLDSPVLVLVVAAETAVLVAICRMVVVRPEERGIEHLLAEPVGDRMDNKPRSAAERVDSMVGKWSKGQCVEVQCVVGIEIVVLA